MKSPRSIITHSSALLAGAALAAGLSALAAKRPQETSQGIAKIRETREGAKSGERVTGGTGRGESKSAAFQQAWRLLMKEALAPEERMHAQGNIMREWALVDLDGAIQAYLGEAWDTRYPGTVAFFSEPLRNGLYNAFQADPIEAWKALGRDKMAKQMLGRAWIEATNGVDPALLASMVCELPENLQKDAAEMLFRHKQHRELLLQLARTGTPAQAERWLADAYARMGYAGDPAGLSAKWTAAPPGPERVLDMANWAGNLRRADLATTEAEWEKVPEADRGQAARILLAPLDGSSPSLLFAIDRAIEAGEWNALSQDAAEKLHRWEGADADALMEWALDLPEKPELAAIYQAAVLRGLKAGEGGREWLDQLPQGSWQRDQGLAALVRSEIENHGDLPAARRALEAISDPGIRRSAGEQLYSKALEKGLKELR